MSRRLLLFDIDQTLINTGGVGMRCLWRAVREVSEISVESVRVNPDGKTDPSILAEIVVATGRSLDGLEDEVWRLYARYLGEELAQADGCRGVKPGIPALLAALANEPRACLGLLTGNLERTARIKLGAFDLDHHFPIGAFGSDNADRRCLGPVALMRARDHFAEPFEPAQVWVIGDTARDVEAAHAFGARALGVATGRVTVDELTGAGAEAVLADLSETEAVVALLLS